MEYVTQVTYNSTVLYPHKTFGLVTTRSANNNRRYVLISIICHLDSKTYWSEQHFKLKPNVMSSIVIGFDQDERGHYVAIDHREIRT